MKKAIIITIIVLYVLLTLGFLYYDFIELIPRRADWLKYSTIVLSFLTAVFLWKHSFNKRDATLLTLAMFCTVVTDIFLVLTPSPRLYVLGMVLYGQTMCVYFFRYQKSKYGFILPLFAYIPVMLFTLNVDPQVSVTTFYIQVLVTNLISVGQCVRNKKFPKANTVLIVTALILFVCGDIMVLLRTPLVFNVRLASKFIFVFYTPSQALLAFSSYDFSKNTKKIVEGPSPGRVSSSRNG